MKGIKYAAFNEILPERDVTSDGFSKGQINFKLNYHSMKRWNPYKSYVRMRVRLSDNTGDILESTSGIAPNMFQGDCLWQQISATCNGVVVSEVNDYVAQVAALKHRYSVSESRRSNFMKDLNFGQAEIDDRIREVTVDGFKRHSPHLYDIRELIDDAGGHPAFDETFVVRGGAENVIEYKNDDDSKDGTVDLETTQLDEGYYLFLNGIANDTLLFQITSVNSKSLIIEPNAVAFPITEIGINKFFYSKEKPIPGRRVKEYELCFKPCMGLFSLDDYLPGNWKLEFTPHTRGKFPLYAVETRGALDITDFNFEVLDMRMYVWEGMMNAPRSGPETYNFTEVRCQGQTVTDRSLTTKTFAINGGSHTFTLAFQKSDAGDLTNYSRTKFKMLSDYELSLRSYLLRINGVTLPAPKPSIEYDPLENRDFTTQQYYETLHYNGTIMLDEPESLTDWITRGPYYSYVMPIDKRDNLTRIHVSCEFYEDVEEPFTMLLFDHFYAGFKLDIENGMVTRCERVGVVD